MIEIISNQIFNIQLPLPACVSYITVLVDSSYLASVQIQLTINLQTVTVVVQRLSDAAAIFLPLFGSWLPERLQPAQSVIASRVTVPNFKTTYQRPQMALVTSIQLTYAKMNCHTGQILKFCLCSFQLAANYSCTVAVRMLSFVSVFSSPGKVWIHSLILFRNTTCRQVVLARLASCGAWLEYRTSSIYAPRMMPEAQPVYYFYFILPGKQQRSGLI